MKTTHYIVDHPSQLNALAGFPLLRTRAVGALRLAGSISDHPRREEWEAALNRHYRACGCDVSAKGLLLGLAAGGLWGIFADGTLARGSAIAVGGAIAGAILGKLTGLLRARLRLTAVIRDIQAHWKVEPAAPVEAWNCG